MGLGLFWKRRGPTSGEALAEIKRSLGLAGNSRRGIGHGGTLDPFAEGWLLVGWGEGSKFLGALRGLSKTYVAEICLGASTETLDNTVEAKDWDFGLKVDEEKLRRNLKSFVGRGLQVPPLYSAKKVGGRSSYELLRRGIAAELLPCEVELFEAEHLGLRHEGPTRSYWTVRLRVSAGTYIRSFARDWGKALFGEPAHLTRLQRIGLGTFCEAEAREPKIFSNIGQLRAFFQFVWDEKVRPDPEADLGHLLLGGREEARAAWLQDSRRWRYFTSNPLL